MKIWCISQKFSSIGTNYNEILKFSKSENYINKPYTFYLTVSPVRLEPMSRIKCLGINCFSEVEVVYL